MFHISEQKLVPFRKILSSFRSYLSIDSLLPPILSLIHYARSVINFHRHTIKIIYCLMDAYQLCLLSLDTVNSKLPFDGSIFAWQPDVTPCRVGLYTYIYHPVAPLPPTHYLSPGFPPRAPLESPFYPKFSWSLLAAFENKKKRNEIQ